MAPDTRRNEFDMAEAPKAVHEIQDDLPGPRAELAGGAAVRLESGERLGPVRVAYQTWGTLNDARNNTVLICHALTGDQYAFGTHPVTGKNGWWESMVGPASRSTRTVSMSCVRTVLAVAWERQDRRPSILQRVNSTARRFRSSPSATWSMCRRCFSITSASKRSCA